MDSFSTGEYETIEGTGSYNLIQKKAIFGDLWNWSCPKSGDGFAEPVKVQRYYAIDCSYVILTFLILINIYF